MLYNYLLELWTMISHITSVMPKGSNLTEMYIMSAQHLKHYLTLVLCIYTSVMAGIILKRKIEARRQEMRKQCPDTRLTIRKSVRYNYA